LIHILQKEAKAMLKTRTSAKNPNKQLFCSGLFGKALKVRRLGNLGAKSLTAEDKGFGERNHHPLKSFLFFLKVTYFKAYLASNFRFKATFWITETPWW